MLLNGGRRIRLVATTRSADRKMQLTAEYRLTKGRRALELLLDEYGDDIRSEQLDDVLAVLDGEPFDEFVNKWELDHLVDESELTD